MEIEKYEAKTRISEKLLLNNLASPKDMAPSIERNKDVIDTISNKIPTIRFIFLIGFTVNKSMAESKKRMLKIKNVINIRMLILLFTFIRKTTENTDAISRNHLNFFFIFVWPNEENE
ncbi:MAG: hypothetical protein HC831_03080 [Chloroflexia bacterium]|nr:hypothetical protein [Chloroflexia bacterium]